jgi:hypothetical protein
LDLQQPVESVSITGKVNFVSLSSAHEEVHSIHHYVIEVCQRLAACWWICPVSSINKTDGHDITEILLKVVLNIIPFPIKLGIHEKAVKC